jgi:hypothetical protein
MFEVVMATGDSCTLAAVDGMQPATRMSRAEGGTRAHMRLNRGRMPVHDHPYHVAWGD